MRLIQTAGLLLSAACWACQNPPAAQDKAGLTIVYTTALQETPGKKSAELRQLVAGTTVLDLGKVSSFLSDVSLNDTLRQEPWLRVQANDGQQGWVYAGALRPTQLDAAAVRRWALAKRFEGLFGPVLAQRWQSWTQTPAPATDSACARVLREGIALRDTLNQLLGRNVTRDAEHPLPDLFWLSEMSPYFVVQQINGGSTYHLYLDFRVIGQVAGRTSGPQDDAYCRLCWLAYPADSIESALPVWVFPLSADAGCSNLGQGNHLRMLRAIDVALTSSALFQPELNGIKDQVLEDITGLHQRYWQPETKILEELGQILTRPPKCLSAQDILALEARRKMFETPAANGIEVNLRSGE